jgi:hypothetical protein
MKLPKQKSIKKRTQNKRSCNHKNEDQIKKKEIIIKKMPKNEIEKQLNQIQYN